MSNLSESTGPMEVVLHHLGNNCAPGIIINDILGIKQKSLFMLLFIPFWSMVDYITNDNLEEIHDFDHWIIENGAARHTKYKFGFNHECKFNDQKELINADKIHARFTEKIDYFRGNDPQKVYVYIHFTHQCMDEEFYTPYIHRLVSWFQQQNRNFHILVFTDNAANLDKGSEHVHVAFLDTNWDQWWEPTRKKALYATIYSTFLAAMAAHVTPNHAFPKSFEETPIGIAL